MSSLARMRIRLRAWTSFSGIARATRTLAAAQVLQWSEHVRRIGDHARWCTALARAWQCPAPDPDAPLVVLAIGTDLGLCGSLNNRVAAHVAPLLERASVTLVVGSRLADELAWPAAAVFTTPTSFAAIEQTGGEIAALLGDVAPTRIRLSIVVTSRVEPDGAPVVTELGSGDDDNDDPNGDDDNEDRGPTLDPRAAALSPSEDGRRRAASLVLHARIVAALARGARSEAEARLRVMTRAHDAAERRIERESRRLRNLHRESITQDMLETRRGRGRTGHRS